MNPADVQRILLGLAVFVMGYLLILQWQEDYGGRPAEAPPPVLEDASPQVVPLPGEEPAPREIGALDGAPGALPAADDAAGRGVQGSDSGAIRETRLVRVDTDTYQAWIDLRGGNLVRLLLPKYPLSIDAPDQPLPLFIHDGQRVYIAQSGLVGADGPDATGHPPLYTAAAPRFAMGDADELIVPLRYTREGVEYVKRYTFHRDSYRIGVGIDVINSGSRPLQVAMYGHVKRDAERPIGEVTVTLGPHPYLGGAVTTPEDPYERITFDDLDEARFSLRQTGGWIALVQHYFVSAWIPGADAEYGYYGEKLRDGTYRLGFISATTAVAPGSHHGFEATLYAGPKIKSRLEAAAPHLGLTVDYGILYWIAEPLFWLLSRIHALVGNWGVAIILLTVLIKLLLYPLSEASFRSMANMKRVAPEMKRLQERYADDRQKLSAEMMELYKREKVNPLGGCLPIVLQMPVFISLYWVLYEAIELRQAPFVFWIKDLSVMDPLFILPILMGASMFVTQLLNPPPPDPVQAQVMRIMPFMFTFLFLFFPAGLVLYWLVNNLLSIGQQWLVNRRVQSASARS